MKPERLSAYKNCIAVIPEHLPGHSALVVVFYRRVRKNAQKFKKTKVVLRIALTEINLAFAVEFQCSLFAVVILSEYSHFFSPFHF